MTDISNMLGAERRQAAERALNALTEPGEHVALRVRCGRGHHVATVFRTPSGPVFRSEVGPSAHGGRDFVDTAHGAHRHGTGYADLLAADTYTDDGLPATCECGPHTLSRSALQEAFDSGRSRVQLP